MTITEPAATFSASAQETLNNDTVESVWEEAEAFLQKSSNVDFNFISLMALSGTLAAVGLSTGTLHLVLAAMLIIPGFAPIVNIPLGITLKNSRLIRLGLKSTFYGYGVYTVAAILVFHILRLVGNTSVQAFIEMPMVQYWASFNTASIIVSIVAAAAGVIIVPTHRSVLTAGVMVALALIPGAAIFGICLTSGQWEYAMRGLAQWTLDSVNIILTGILIFWLKNLYVHKRRSWY